MPFAIYQMAAGAIAPAATTYCFNCIIKLYQLYYLNYLY